MWFADPPISQVPDIRLLAYSLLRLQDFAHTIERVIAAGQQASYY